MCGSIHCGLLALALHIATAAASASELTVSIVGKPSVVFDSTHDSCAPGDMPDVNPRAFRDASGQVVMFALHDQNRALTGPDLDHLKIECRVALGSPHAGDPALYEDRNFVTATWTDDGRKVSALVHHEYHADEFGRCRASGDLACWYNTIVAYHSDDGGRTFARAAPFVVAAAPFGQDVEQGRQRGFFNPSNIVSDGRYAYAMISTTGWDGQFDGVCLFRNADPANSGGWRAFDGSSFSIRYADPYKGRIAHQPACQTLAPSVFPVGSLNFHRASRTWIATFQAKAGGAMPLDGIYYATSRDLLHWGAPRILLVAATLYDDLCSAGPTIVGYPSILDPASPSRNFDEVGDEPELFLTTMHVANCRTTDRILLRERLAIKWKVPS